jgi:acyl carrier protein
MKSRIFNRIAGELSDPTKLSRAIEARKPVQHRKSDRYAAPQTEFQQALASLWGEFLKVDLVGLDDNFFELGGHSLLAMQIGFQIGERFSVEFPLEAFLMTPVLRAQAQRIEEMLFRQANENDLERLLAEIEQEVLGYDSPEQQDLNGNGSYSPEENFSGSAE